MLGSVLLPGHWGSRDRVPGSPSAPECGWKTKIRLPSRQWLAPEVGARLVRPGIPRQRISFGEVTHTGRQPCHRTARLGHRAEDRGGDRGLGWSGRRLRRRRCSSTGRGGRRWPGRDTEGSTPRGQGEALVEERRRRADLLILIIL